MLFRSLDGTGQTGKAESDGGAFAETIIEKLYIENLLAVLSDEERDLLVLRFVNDEPISLICDELNISRFALYRRIRNIKKKLREATGNISQVAKLAALADGCIDIYSGNDDQVLPILSLGGKGVISVWSNVAPKQVHDTVQSFMDGDIAKATKMQLEAIDLIGALFSEVNQFLLRLQ